MGRVIRIDVDGGGSVGQYPQVEFRANLPITLGSPAIGEVYLVEKPTTILLGIYTTYQSGLYIRENNTGALSDWTRLNIKLKYLDSEFAIASAADESKQAKFDLSSLTTATTITLTIQDKDGAISLHPTNEVVINSQADFPALVGGKIPLADNTNYVCGSSLLFITAPFDLSGISGSTFFIVQGFIIYSGSETMLQGTYSGSFEMTDFGVQNTSGQKIFDITGIGTVGNIFNMRRGGFFSFNEIGIIQGVGGLVILGVTQFIDCGGGLIFKDLNSLNCTIFPNNSGGTTNKPQIVLDNIFGDITFGSFGLNVNSGESVFQISPNITLSKALISTFGYEIGSGAEFLASAKIGSVTVVADNGSGKARMTITGHGITVEQTLVLSAFASELTYNGTFPILEVVDANTLDIDVSFTATDTGDSTTGDSNDFLDDNRFDFKSNGDQIDTNEIGKYKSNTNIPISISSSNTPVNIVGNGGDWDAIIERRFEMQFAGDPNGSMRYTGEKPLSFRISARITVDDASKGVTGYITLNGVTQTDSRFSGDTPKVVTLNPEDIITLNPGDTVGMSIENNDDDSDLDILFSNINIIKS